MTLTRTTAFTPTLTFALQVPGCLVGGDGDKSGRDYCFEFEMTAGVQCDDARLGGRVGVKVITVSSCDMRHMNCLRQLGALGCLSL